MSLQDSAYDLEDTLKVHIKEAIEDSTSADTEKDPVVIEARLALAQFNSIWGGYCALEAELDNLQELKNSVKKAIVLAVGP